MLNGRLTCCSLFILALCETAGFAHPTGNKQPPRLELSVASRILHAPARWQQIAVFAHFADGSRRDVTRLTVFSSSDPKVADVSAAGLVEFQQTGEVAILCRYTDLLQTINLTYVNTPEGFTWPNPPQHNFIDKHVFARLKLLHFAPSDLCQDHEFARRAYLDLCGRIPTIEEIKGFLADDRADRRQRLVDELLKTADFADFWTYKWLELLRSRRRDLHKEGVEAYRRWFWEHLRKNTPFDQTVRELLTATGNTYINGAANYFRTTRDPWELGESTAQLFLGVRLACARCHNHPFENITQDDYFSTAAFFARVRAPTASGKPNNNKNPEPLVVEASKTGDVRHLRTGQIVAPRFLGGKVPDIAPDQDRREVFAAWLTAPENPYFARSVVNRVWYHLFGKGIVDPPDDFRDSNPSANPELLDALTRDFVEHHFDLRHLLRTILASRTYQLSAKSNDFNKDDQRFFSHVYPRPLLAEQLLDALSDVTEVPEVFPGFPKGMRAIQLPDSDVVHPFLDVFGRPARMLACECERVSEPNLAQALHMVNSSGIQEKLNNPKNRIGRLLAKKLSDREMLEELFWAGLSRPPRANEVRIGLEHVAKNRDRRAAWENVLWAIMSTHEFMKRN